MKMNLTPKAFYILSGVVVAAGAGLLWITNASISDQASRIATLRKELRDEKTVLTELGFMNPIFNKTSSVSSAG